MCSSIYSDNNLFFNFRIDQFHGEFIVNTPEGKQKIVVDWLESVYLVKEKGELKFKFYFSEAIKNTSIPFEEK